ncbi:LysE family transporter [Fluviicola chungangensis]|uniref:Lysine transporter LysE n=1 Tax=Fluviicola chungangensis TaxID=2597671 RepID=A0A556N5T7_9FLAO|nr:LysE family transporter [Fluviicola chungangensis]TSJ47547.1 hypothetical protein FO442_00015 [Fluviicola chungangensis]
MRFFKNWKHIGFIGGFISLMGTLPFGVLNVLAFTIGAKESVADALLFSFGVIIAEVAIVACCLKWFLFLFRKKRLWEMLQYLMIGFIFFLAIQQIQQIGTPLAQKTDLLASKFPRFFLGLSLSALNPSQFPFWIAWNTVLKEQGLLSERHARNKYLIGIGCGTFLGLVCFIACSQLIDDASGLLESPAYHLIIACLFAGIGLLILFKSFWKRWYSNGWR